MEKLLLIERMGIVASIKKGKKKGAKLEFYGNYSVYVFKCLRKPVFQKFLNWILKREKIRKERIKNVQIRMFPSIKKNGNSLAGRCNTNGEIFLYPKTRKSCIRAKQKSDLKGFLKYLQGRARASLIHELLHVKYKDDEDKVKSLTKKYYAIFHKNIGSNPLVFKKNQKMIFNY
jgi:hypothetical protein